MDTKTKEAKHLILRVIEYGMQNEEINLYKMKDDLELNHAKFQYVRNSLIETEKTHSNNPNHILVGLKLKTEEHINDEDSVNISVQYIADLNESTYTLLPNAFFSYTDHLEIVEARKAAKDAKKQSFWAIAISLLALVVSIVFGLLELVDVKI